MTVTDQGPARSEAIGQAREWDRQFGLYKEAGLCVDCAAQGAWGAQGGFDSVRPPCRSCKGKTPHVRASRKAARWISGEAAARVSTGAPDSQCSMSASYQQRGRSTCTTCRVSWVTAREAHCNVHHDHFESWDEFAEHRADKHWVSGQREVRSEASARVLADKEMNRIAKLPVSLRGSGAYMTAAEQRADMPFGWIVSEIEPGYPWAR